MTAKKDETRIKALTTEVKNLKEKLKVVAEKLKGEIENHKNTKMLMVRGEKNRHLIEWRLKKRANNRKGGL